MAESEEQLRRKFNEFVKFGTRAATNMDSAKWYKFCKENRLMSKKINRTEVDMIFTRCKPRSAGSGMSVSGGRLEFDDFIRALRQLSELKFSTLDPEEAYSKVVNERILRVGGPVMHSSAAEAAGIVKKSKASSITDRLTDTSKYTGAHKHRFDESGRGRGIVGRDRVAKGGGSTSGTIGVPMGSDPMIHSRAVVDGRSEGRTSEKGRSDHDLAAHASEGYVGSYRPEDKHKKTNRKAKSITDRLTNPSTYTGAHKHRFRADGTGAGKAGRTGGGGYTGYVGSYKGGDHGAGRDLDWRAH